MIKVSKIVLLVLLAATAVAILKWNSQSLSDQESSWSSEVVLLDRPERTQLGIEWNQTQENWHNYIAAVEENDEQKTEALLALAEICIGEARITGEHGHYYPTALELTEQVLQDPNTEESMVFYALTLQAGVQLSLHNFSKAQETALRAVSIQPLNAQIWGVLTDCYVELGDYQKAIEAADQMVNLRPDLRSYSRVAYLREIHGRVEPAIEAMKLAVSAGYPSDEETAWAMQTLADMLMEYGQVDQAEEWYRKILAQRTDYPFAYAGLAKVHWREKNYKRADELYQIAISIIPEVGFFIDLATMRKELGEPHDDLLTSIFFMLQDDTQSGHNMNLEYANIYTQLLDRPTEAIPYLQKEYEERPDNIDVNQLMAEVYYNLNDMQKAESHLQSALSTQSQKPALLQLSNQIGKT